MSADTPGVARSIAVAITGASGAVYATRTMAALLERGCHVELIVSDYGRRLLRDELGERAAVDRLSDYLAAAYGEGSAARAPSRSTATRISERASRAAARTAKAWSSCPAR